MVLNETLSAIDCCESIAAKLIKAAPLLDNGLFTGKSGCCIFLYELAKFTGNDYYGAEADKLLTEICGNIDPRHGLSFSNGLFGLGWALDVMQELDFIEVDEAQIMRYIDNVSSCTRFFNYSLPYGFLGHGTYLVRRESKWPQNDSVTFESYNKLFVVCDELYNLLEIHMSMANRYNILEMSKYINAVSPGSLMHFFDEIATSIFLYTRLLKKRKYVGVLAHYLQRFEIACKLLLETFLSSTASIDSLDKDPDGAAIRIMIFKLYASLFNLETVMEANGPKVNWNNIDSNLEFLLTTFDCKQLTLKHTFYVIQMIRLLTRMKEDHDYKTGSEKLRQNLLHHCIRIAITDINEPHINSGLAGLSGIGLCLLGGLTKLDVCYDEAWGI